MTTDPVGVTRHEPVTIDAGQRAVVIAPVAFRDERPYTLFTKRADHLGEHSGQMSFPGGGREPSDADLWVTVLREPNKETGPRPEEAALRGRLDDIRTVIGYAVSSFVATVPNRVYEPDQREMAEIVVLAVGDLINRTNYELERRDHPQYGKIWLHFFYVDGCTIWGATGRMLVQLLELTTSWRVSGEVNRVVDLNADYPV